MKCRALLMLLEMYFATVKCSVMVKHRGIIKWAFLFIFFNLYFLRINVFMLKSMNAGGTVVMQSQCSDRHLSTSAPETTAISRSFWSAVFHRLNREVMRADVSHSLQQSIS